MLIASSTSRAENRRQLAKASRRAEIPVGIQIIGAEPRLATMAWSSYWQPCREFVEFDRRLVHRLVQLKKAWVSVLRNPTSTPRQQMFCWRHSFRPVPRNPDGRGRTAETCQEAPG